MGFLFMLMVYGVIFGIAAGIGIGIALFLGWWTLPEYDEEEEEK